jgi:flagellar motor switch protein FliG
MEVKQIAAALTGAKAAMRNKVFSLMSDKSI